MSDIDIRAARPTDLTRVLHFASAFYIEDRFATPVSELRDNLVVLLHTGTARVAVAGRQHDIVGFAITTLGIGLEQGTVAELNDLFVEPAHRRTGVAAALIDDSADWVRSRGCRTRELVIAPNRANVAHLFCSTPIKTSPTSAWSNVSPDGGGICSALPCGR
jgi:GNAT superfamily N-acetyltransferase